MLHNLSGLRFPGVCNKQVGPLWLLPGSKILCTFLLLLHLLLSIWCNYTSLSLVPQGVSLSVSLSVDQ